MLLLAYNIGGNQMGQEPTITLSIKESGERPNSTYLFHVLLDGKAITSNQSLSLQDSRTVREASRSFGSLFEQGYRPEMDADSQRALGKQLFDLWLASSWEKIKAGVPVGALRFLVIASEAPEILNLPWELLLLPDGEFLGINPLFRIRRLPGSGKQLAPFKGELRPRPLRLLFMACSPTDLPELDYEREEEALLRSVAGQDVAFDSCDLGTFDELKERVNEFKPHVVHLTGHGAVINGQGHFAFEKEDGTADLVSSENLRRFLAGSGVQCVFVSGCQSGKAPVQSLGGICQGLVGAEVPLAVGWAASIADDLATNFARTFYKTIKNAQPVDRALLQARQEAWKAYQGVGDPSWALPVLYSATSQSFIFDPDHQRPPEEPTRQNLVLEALPGMKEGHAEHFVGRRREQRLLLPALKSGDLQIVIITGLGGSGKSTLATRLARKLENNGFVPIPISSSRENPLNSARLLQAFGDSFRQEARKYRRSYAPKADELAALAEDLGSAKIPVESRLHDAVIALNEGKFLLILDNFETNMDGASLHILDSEISGFYKYLLENLSGGSRSIITTRYPPSDLLFLPPKVHKEDLSDFSESSFIKILQRDPVVERRIRYGELSLALLSDLHKKFGGTPRFILQIREAIKKMDVNVLEMELANVKLPAGIQLGELQNLRDKYFGDIFTERLYGYLTPESQKALSRAAVYGVPVTLQGLAAAAGEPIDRVKAYAQNWQNRAFAYQDSEKSLWIVYSLLRPWLLEKLSSEERKNTHKLAGKFLVDMEELNQADELGLTSMDCVMEARSQYLSAEEIESARVLTMRLSGSLILSGFYDEVRQLNAELLGYKSHPSPMIWIANAYSDQGKYDSARCWYQRSLDASGDSNYKEIAAAWHGLATVDLKKGDYDAAYEKFQKSIAIDKQIGDRISEASTLHNLATIELNKGNYDSAREKFEMVIEIRQQIGDRSGESSALHQLATVDLKKGDYDSALEEFQKSMQISLEIGDRSGEASALNNMATIHLYKGDYDLANKELEKAMKIVQQIGDRVLEASIWNNLATIDLNKGDYDWAHEKFEKVLKVTQEINDPVGEASILSNLAAIDLNKGNYDLARKELEKAVKIMHRIGNRGGEASILYNLATIDMIRGDRNSARGKLEKAIKIMQQIGDRAGEAAAFRQLGILAWEEGRVREGMRLVALGWLINSFIYHVDAQSDVKNLSVMASELGYTQEQLEAMMKEVTEAYGKDRGRGLINAAFLGS
jgi:tetratricopeptide (TPR) repeat protein